jgi:inner membrane protein
MNRTLFLKLLTIGGLMGIIWIALIMVNSTVDERSHTIQEAAIKSVHDTFAGSQTLVGPVLVRPYTQTTESVEDDDRGRPQKVEHTEQLYTLTYPHLLDVKGNLKPHGIVVGIYTVNVYEAQSQISASLDAVAPQTKGKVEWGEPWLALSIDDVRGITGSPSVSVNGTPEPLLPGAAGLSGWQPNLHIPLRGVREFNGHLDVSLNLTLNGAVDLSVAPIADFNHIELSSTWPTPRFPGQFRPRSVQTTHSGFTASWDIPSLATTAQAEMQANPTKPIDTIGVSLVKVIDVYRESDRATHYGILFILLTFGGFFLFEMLKQLPIHPIQYLLVGFGLAIFFLLLLSFAEHIPFALSYILASFACVGLLTFYLSFVLRSIGRGIGFGVMLGTLYGAVYGLLISEDYALVLGSLLMFAVLAGVMIVTRKIDWYSLRPAHPEPVS